MPYTSFFNNFPKIQYDINNTLYSNYETVTDLFLRIGVVKEVINNISSYYVYELDDGDTPESLAEQVYGDAGAGWMILYANYMFDPQFDWILNYDEFQKFIIAKYGSIEAAKTTVHHYEKVIQRTLEPDNVTTEKRFVVDYQSLTENVLDVPYEYITGGGGGELSYNHTIETFNIFGKTVTQVSFGEAIYCYDYENELNEQKRLIKVIKAEYYNRIMTEFKTLTNVIPPYSRRLT